MKPAKFDLQLIFDNPAHADNPARLAAAIQHAADFLRTKDKVPDLGEIQHGSDIVIRYSRSQKSK